MQRLGLASAGRGDEFRGMRYRHQPVLAALMFLVPATFIPGGLPAAAQSLGTVDEKQYQTCMQQTRIDPSAAFEMALGWQDLGGGVPAKHCSAVALMMLGHYQEAASRLEELARQMPDEAPSEIVADILAHAGIAWMEAGNLDRAYSVQSAALELTPDRPMILVDRALVLGQMDRFWECIDDLNRAIELDPTDPAAFTMRASAYRFVEANGLAMEDANRALELDPTHPEALLERGILHRLAGDKDAARRDWIKLVEEHDGRPAADDARRNLELLDVAPAAQ